MWNGSDIAVALLPGRLRLLSGRANGRLEPRARGEATLDEALLRPGLRAPNVTDAEAVVASLRRVAEDAGVLGRRPELVAVVVPDAAVRVTMVPIEGEPPGRAQGESMARWALRDRLPIDASEARVDWAVLEGADGTTAPSRWLVAVGADRAVVREYEAVVEALGWTVGRVVPWTLALAVAAELDAGRAGLDAGVAEGAGESGLDTSGQEVASGGVEVDASGVEVDAGGVEAGAGGVGAEGEGADAGGLEADAGGTEIHAGGAAVDAPRGARLLLAESGGRLACLVEADGVPRLHRAWRRSMPAEEIGGELSPLSQYVGERLEMTIRDVVATGSDAALEAIEAVCGGLGWSARPLSGYAALLGALVR